MARADVAPVGREPHVAQHFERAQQNRQRRPAGGDPLQVVLVEAGSRSLDEALDESIVVLGRRLAE